MKRIKKIDGSFTLETTQRASEENELLCDQCANADCTIRLIVNRVKINRFNAKLAIIKCESFIPFLKFRDVAGTESEFNTIRLGGAWAERVERGDIVALRNAENVDYAFAEVTNTHKGKFRDVNRVFGVNNHLAIEAAVCGEDFDLEKVMIECYGRHRFSSDSIVSAIELRRIDGASDKG